MTRVYIYSRDLQIPKEIQKYLQTHLGECSIHPLPYGPISHDPTDTVILIGTIPALILEVGWSAASITRPARVIQFPPITDLLKDPAIIESLRIEKTKPDTVINPDPFPSLSSLLKTTKIPRTIRVRTVSGIEVEVSEEPSGLLPTITFLELISMAAAKEVLGATELRLLEK